MQKYFIGIDVGGTFSDVVVVDAEGSITTEKAPTTPEDPTDGMLHALLKVSGKLDISVNELLSETARFVYGSTIALNTLVEKKGEKTAFITTKGFKDTLVMRRTWRENMYDLRAEFPEPLIPRNLIFELNERVNRDGETIDPISEEEVDAIVTQLEQTGIESVGISLIFAFRNPSNEQKLVWALQQRLPNLLISSSSELCPEIRDYERASTVAVNAYLQPRVNAHLKKLSDQLAAKSLAIAPQIMQSNGGVIDAQEAAQRAVNLLLSGPAGGVIGGVLLNELLNEPQLIAFDMGGTSCDLSLIYAGKPIGSTYLSQQTRFTGWDIITPFIDIHSIGSGGGSLAWLDKANGLHLGPQSAGAEPGPVCYGKGGTAPTVTDANLLLGYLNPTFFLGGTISLDQALATEALERMAAVLNLTSTELASGLFQMANEQIINAIQVITLQKGYDPQAFTLLCFGGAGALHAPAVAAQMGIQKVIVPRQASTYSAMGLLASDIQLDFVRSPFSLLKDSDQVALEKIFQDMEMLAAKELKKSGVSPEQMSFQRQADMRYLGQSHEIRVLLTSPGCDLAALKQAYEVQYEEIYGYLNELADIQLVNLRLSALGSTIKPQFKMGEPSSLALEDCLKSERKAYFKEANDYLLVPVYDGGLLACGHQFEGPAIIELDDTTIVIRPQQSLTIDDHGNFIILAA
ncbi:hydantoinase/oxoprolinase family protein [Leptolyngbya sp. KIOST-1]|uniref:hydantoinase/oxoprolinase family protein n=1 Tax=Leptolyngbya sp. KIOST-1 TaxID=1229172 RepID=UPI0005656285|nr:hydantoinase/oxoprolinase family protein [Leptolyngbya sp. KIOST-1]